jgi:hypothetical protein
LSENEEALLIVNSVERRTDKRFLINARVEIAGVDIAGNPFMERTSVRDFSDAGCRFRTQMHIRRGDTVAIKPLGSDGQSLPQEQSKWFEIMWGVRCASGWMVGARVSRQERNENRESASVDRSPARQEK